MTAFTTEKPWKRRFVLVLAAGLAMTLASCGGADAPLKGARLSVVVSEPEPPRLSARAGSIAIAKPRANSSWGQAGATASHNPGHLALGRNPQILFRKRFAGLDSGPLIAQPIVSGRRLFLQDGFARIHALHAQSGKTLWRRDLAKRGAPAFGGGMSLLGKRLFVATGLGVLAALSPETGEILWKTEPSTPIRAAPLAHRRIVLALGHDNKINAHTIEDGRLIWFHQGTLNPATILTGATGALEGRTVVVPYSSGEIFALRLENGAVSWQTNVTLGSLAASFPTSITSLATPVIDRGRIIAVSNAGKTLALDIRTGEKIWSQNVAGLEMPWVAGNVIFLAAEDRRVYCLQAETGELLWSAPLPETPPPAPPTIWRGPILAGGLLYLSSSTGRLVAMNPSNGAIVRDLKLSNAFHTAPIVADRTLYLIAGNAEIIALR